MYGLIANVLSDRVLRTGAKVRINYCNGDAACPIVYGLSKIGRMVRKYTHYKRLTNFRAAWIPPHWRNRLAYQWATKEDAEKHAAKLAEMWSGVRYFNRYGTLLLRDGVTEEEVFRRARHSSNDQVKWPHSGPVLTGAKPICEASLSNDVLCGVVGKADGGESV